MRKFLNRLVMSGVLATSTLASAGPVVIGGDDLNDHGSWTGTVNAAGWLYIQNALSNLVSQVTLSGNDGTIVVLGSAPTVPAASTPTTSNGCGAAYWPALAISRTVTCIDGAPAITAYLVGVASGANRPAVLLYPGSRVSNDVDAAEEAALTENAATIAAFVANGGGLLAHSGAYTWLSALVPGITILGACESGSAVLTPAGIAAFPTISNANITAGPCHNTFGGNLGGLQVLARDGTGANFILGGGAGTTFAVRAPDPIPTLDRFGLIALALALAAAVGLGRKHLKGRA